LENEGPQQRGHSCLRSIAALADKSVQLTNFPTASATPPSVYPAEDAADWERTCSAADRSEAAVPCAVPRDVETRCAWHPDKHHAGDSTFRCVEPGPRIRVV